ncbi:DsbA family protein [Glaciecola petra]|uniref:DsbA family protein n=1 Tax=Glaciecola petra TaxID=3075602 RepID=A0ABU2ZRA1_9ALTE|nr:DsbA family protein [Aestuariibacter sp. P117]MDT0594921.1 DsbA family protein [Aestuariibacter sp. P117]
MKGQSQAPKFTRRSGASESNPSIFRRWLLSKAMTYLFSKTKTVKRHRKAELKRQKTGEAHRIEYFHQVDDAYSHLVAQILTSFVQRYDAKLVCHLVESAKGDNSPEPELLLKLSRYDAFYIAPEYGLSFPEHEKPIAPNLLQLASKILAKQDSKGFIACVAKVGEAMWAGDKAALDKLSVEYGMTSETTLENKLNEGKLRRESLKHYSGAMLYYGNEWYWGVDRLYHLEKRLAKLGLDTAPKQPLLVDRPSLNAGTLKDSGKLTLEIYASLRSPYTAICFDRTVELASQTGVNLTVKPILPMVMRGVPATLEKGLYIFMDTAREADAANVSYGNFYDPIGEPVRNAYSLYPWVKAQGREVDYFSSFLNCVFAQGINTNKTSGIKTVVEQAGLDWQEAKTILGKPGWESMLEENRLTMYKLGIWGVPSFRLLNENGEQVFATWGQDRLWLVAREIQRQLSD